MPVPFIDLKRFENGFLDRWNTKIADMTKNTQFVGGPEVSSLEETIARYNSAPFAVGCSSGTDAIQLALRAAGIGKGDTVLLPEATFWATFEAVINVNAEPVCVDIDPVDLQMDFGLFQEAVKKYQPKAAILVHLYGWGSAKLQEYRDFCKNNGIALVEDGAQAYGVEFNGKPIFSESEYGTISFYPAKTLGAAGDAGAVVTSTKEAAEKIRSLANHGREEHYAHGDVGWNARMSSFQAAFLNFAHEVFPERLKSRRDIAARYHKELSAIGVKTVQAPTGFVENGYLNVTLHEPDVREKLKAALAEKKIGFGIVYPGAVSEQKGAENYLKGTVGGAKQAKILASSVLNLPLFPYMTDGEFDEVMEAVTTALK